mmetsp:Transcript_18966/g.18292  ORF Transcript_18966/g.18292 Transcript_18966/m.18292 type:complete len:176 (+) Transcript_18966:204-731(+)
MSKKMEQMNREEQKDWKEEFQKLICEKYESTALTIKYRSVYLPYKGCIHAHLDISHFEASIGFSLIEIRCTLDTKKSLAEQKVAELACEMITTDKITFTVEKKGQVDVPRNVLRLGLKRSTAKMNTYRTSKGIREIVRSNDSLLIRGEPHAVDLLLANINEDSLKDPNTVLDKDI